MIIYSNATLIANFVLLVLLVVTSLSIVFFRNLIINTVVMCIFSLIMALLYLVMDAPDVAITEASVGAGVSTVFMLVALSLVKNRRAKTSNNRYIPFIIALTMFVCLLYAVIDMPNFGDFNSPINKHVAPFYIENTYTYMGIPNVVTAILASFRGYDTLCETVVVFTAALGVLLLLKESKKSD